MGVAHHEMQSLLQERQPAAEPLAELSQSFLDVQLSAPPSQVDLVFCCCAESNMADSNHVIVISTNVGPSLQILQLVGSATCK